MMTRHLYDIRRQADRLQGKGYAHLSSEQLPYMEKMCLTEIHLGPGGHLAPHSHPDAGELCYILAGEVSYSLAAPSTKEPHTYILQPGQALYAPSGWYHWLTPLTAQTMLLLIYNQDNPHQSELLPWRVSELYPVMGENPEQAEHQAYRTASTPAPPWLAAQQNKTTNNR